MMATQRNRATTIHESDNQLVVEDIVSFLAMHVETALKIADESYNSGSGDNNRMLSYWVPMKLERRGMRCH